MGKVTIFYILTLHFNTAKCELYISAFSQQMECLCKSLSSFFTDEMINFHLQLDSGKESE